MKIFLSFQSTFRGWIEDRLTKEQLQEGHFVFGWDREKLLLPGQAPSSLTIYNKNLPKLVDLNGVCTLHALDPVVLAKWTALFEILQEREKSGRISWNKNNNNYLKRALDYLESGHDVYFDGEWQRKENLLWLTHKD